MSMELSIIIVNYRSRNKLLNCLESLRADSQLPVSEIIVVDNASGESLEDLPGLFPNLRLIASRKNLGMGGGNNLGLEAARGEYALILNPDTAVRAGAAALMLAYLKTHPQTGIIGPKLVYPDGALQHSCARFPTFFMPVLRRTFLGEYFKKARDSFMMTDFDHASFRKVDWLMGSCLMFKKEILLADGQVFRPRFDSRYFMYFEDIDLCREFRRRGLEAAYYPDAVVIHDHQRSSAKHPWYIALVRDKLTWMHIVSWLKYFIKWGFKTNSYA